ncbi:MAG: RNA ligase family protein [Anaerolineae bacterium]|nr:RNA ligase family protein [Anaerolineae bacterium]
MNTPGLDLFKYPRTHHIEGSRLQPGDEDLDAIPFPEIRGRYLVVEEKMDGANAAVSFTPEGKLLLQSRGHYLRGGVREKHFNLFKQWGNIHAYALWPVLGDRYIMYGEWLYARHTIFYTHLPHYFMEFDVLDKRSGQFLSTARRWEMLDGLPVAPVKVLQEGTFTSLSGLTDLIGPSCFIQGDHLALLQEACREMGLDAGRALRETDPSSNMEGLYIKVEEGGIVQERYKYVRAGFLTAVRQSESHWLTRPIIPNRLAPGVDIFAGAL